MATDTAFNWNVTELDGKLTRHITVEEMATADRVLSISSLFLFDRDQAKDAAARYANTLEARSIANERRGRHDYALANYYASKFADALIGSLIRR